MPTYEYLCRTCSHRFETWQKMTDDSLTTCPECGGPIRRVFFPAGVVFKGSGFYKTDHKTSSSAVSEKAETTKEGETKTASESKSNESSTEKSGTKTNDNQVTANTK